MKYKSIKFFSLLYFSLYLNPAHASINAEVKCLKAMSFRNALASGGVSWVPGYHYLHGWTEGGAVVLAGDTILLPLVRHGDYLVLDAEQSSQVHVANEDSQDSMVNDFYLRLNRDQNNPSQLEVFSISVTDQRASVAFSIAFNEEQAGQADDFRRQAEQAHRAGDEVLAREMESAARFSGLIRMRVEDLSNVPVIAPTPCDRAQSLNSLHTTMAHMISTVHATFQRWNQSWAQNRISSATQESPTPQPGSLEDPSSYLATLETCRSVPDATVIAAVTAELSKFEQPEAHQTVHLRR